MVVSKNVSTTMLRRVSSISWTVFILAILSTPNVLDAAEATPHASRRKVRLKTLAIRSARIQT